MGIPFSRLPIATETASDDYIAMLDTSEEELKRTTVNHASTTDAFGLGTASAYGHTKVVDDLTKSTFANGEALSAHQGNVLANLIAQQENVLPNLIAPTEISPSESAYEIGDYLIFDDNLYKITSAISIGDSLVEGTNIEKTTMMEEIKNSSSGGGTTIVQIPTVTGSPLYDGTPKGPTITGLDTLRVNVEGSTSTEVGPHTITFSLKDPSNMVWNDLTNAPKIIDWDFTYIYGAEWDGTSTTRWTRTDDSALFVDPVPAVNNGTGSSPFDNCSPWKDIKRQTSAISGEVVYIPKFWVKITTPSGGSGLKIQIADREMDGFVPAPAFQDRGDGRGELDYILVGRYHCASDFKSKTGVEPKTYITRSAFRTGIRNLGTDVYQWDYAVRLTLSYLYLVEFADWNSQATIGYGCSNDNKVHNMGATDAMQYHTGTASVDRTAIGVGVQYRYIEGLWDNVNDWVDGIYFSGADVYIIKNPENFSDTSNGTKIGSQPEQRGYISAYFVGTGEYAAFIYPSAANGSSDTYVCDYCNYISTCVVPYVGGSYYNYDQPKISGLFYLNPSNDAGTRHYYTGSRLMELPSISQ